METKNNRLSETIIEMATALYDIGELDITTMRNFKHERAHKIDHYQAHEIKQIRLKAKVSQTVFAKLLNISSETVRKWEQGERKPAGAALKLLNLVAHRGLDALSL